MVNEFMDRAGKWAVGGLTAAAILGTLSPNYALAQQVAEDDPSIVGEDITYASPDGTGDINAYLVRPAEVDADRPPAAVLVVHENRGLNPYIRDVVRTNGKVGATGFCYGGGVVNKLAAAYPEMAAGVPFYGSFPDAAQVAGIEAPLMVQLGALDKRINAYLPRREPRVPQRHHPTLRRGRGHVGRTADGGVVQDISGVTPNARPLR